MLVANERFKQTTDHFLQTKLKHYHKYFALQMFLLFVRTNNWHNLRQKAATRVQRIYFAGIIQRLTHNIHDSLTSPRINQNVATFRLKETFVQNY